jgi:putative endonuclease
MSGYSPAMEKGGYVYILGSNSGVLYVGVTSDLDRRLVEHKSGALPGFTKRYNVHRLLWYERHDGIESAIQREKQIKRWRREKKLALIEGNNPGYLDLAEGLEF